jgi:hypothetical protein
VALDWCEREWGWNDLGNYFALLVNLTQLGNLEAYFLTGIPIVFEENHRPRPCLDHRALVADVGHNLVAYLVALLLYRHNVDARNDDTARWYMRWIKGEEESRAAAPADQRVGGYATTGVCYAAGRQPPR